MGEELKNAKKILKNLDVIILAIKATGGYKFRQRFQLSDRKIDQLCATSEPDIRKMAVSLIVAEAMLRELPPAIHPRWEEYQRRRKECMAELGKK